MHGEAFQGGWKAVVIHGVLESDIEDDELLMHQHAENEVGMKDLFAALNDQVED